MNKLIPLIALVLTLMVGCSSVKPYLTPAALTTDVSQGVRLGLAVYPAATPDVVLARDTVCALAAKGVTDPQAIVNDLEALSITNSNSKLIVNGALFIYEGVYDLIGTNATSQAQPYITALCDGLTGGLPTTPNKVIKSPTAVNLPPHLR